MWYQILNQNDRAALEKIAQVSFPEDSPWFDGHFPGRPVLPGIAQLALVSEILRRGLGQDLRIASISRVRFKQVVRPDEILEVVVRPGRDPEKSFDFRISRRDQQNGQVPVRGGCHSSPDPCVFHPGGGLT